MTGSKAAGAGVTPRKTSKHQEVRYFLVCLMIHFPSVKLGGGKQPKVTVAQNNCFSPKQSVLVKSCFFFQ